MTEKLPQKDGVYYPTKKIQKEAWINKESIYKKASENPVKFWEELAGDLYWKKRWKNAFLHEPPYFKWFSEGKINIAENCLDQNLEKRKDKIALIWEPEPPDQPERKITYHELHKDVQKFANALKKSGVKKGDPVGIYLPMIPEVIVSMLACARIGAVHAVVFSAFSPQSLRVRLQDTEAKVLITADGYYRRGQVINLKNNADEGIKETRVEKVIVVKRAGNEVFWDGDRDHWWSDLISKEKDSCEAEEIDSEDMAFILYTSGSTGKPKGVVHTLGGYAVQVKQTMKWIFDIKDTDVFWSTADIGWITGHTYSCYGPLLCGATFVMFEGAPDWPKPDRWCQVIKKYGVTVFYTAPTAIRMFEKYGTDILKEYDFETLRIIGSVGEPIDESAWLWYFREIGKEKCPLVDTWWQTETGGILMTSLPGLGPFKPSYTGLPLPGINFDILDDEGKSVPPNKEGNLVILPPFAPGLLRDIYKNPKKYLETYWSQCGKEIYFTSDAAFRDEQGLVRIVGRVDDVIKVAGHRISTGELENAIALHPSITESAVIGVPDEIKGEVPLAFVVSKEPKDPLLIEKEVVAQIKKTIGPISLPKKVYLVKDLPKTRSGKIMRRILRKLFTGEELGDLSTLSNPESVEEIKNIITNK